MFDERKPVLPEKHGAARCGDVPPSPTIVHTDSALSSPTSGTRPRRAALENPDLFQHVANLFARRFFGISECHHFHLHDGHGAGREPIDIIVVMEWLRRHDQLDAVGGVDTWAYSSRATSIRNSLATSKSSGIGVPAQASRQGGTFCWRYPLIRG